MVVPARASFGWIKEGQQLTRELLWRFLSHLVGAVKSVAVELGGPRPPHGRRTQLRLNGGLEQFCVLVFRRRAVGVDEEVHGPMVDGLQRCPRLDVDQAAGWNITALWRLAQIHRQCSRQDHERLFLVGMPVATPGGSGLIAPDVGACVREARCLAQLGNVARCLAALVGACDPVELIGDNNAICHEHKLLSASARLGADAVRWVPVRDMRP